MDGQGFRVESVAAVYEAVAASEEIYASRVACLPVNAAIVPVITVFTESFSDARRNWHRALDPAEAQQKHKP